MHPAPPLDSAATIALCLGGLDPSAGAGILRDVLVAAELGVQAFAVPTAETLQNGAACLEIREPGMSPQLRVEALRPHLVPGAWGAKLGLWALADEALAALVGQLRELAPAACIWDPILAPTAGVGLHGPAALRRMAARILPSGGWVVCPNRSEASALAGCETADPLQLARPLLELGAEAVWLKGGHGEGPVEDVWVTSEGARSLGRSERLDGERRGTGCTLASAWLALRLRGRSPEGAAREAAAWLRGRWEAACAPGGFGRPAFMPVPPCV